ncbi:MAG TPA: hypothetical protein VJ853_07060 [Thermoanaerobaculia bacterium]|nr:hypothetical protein [Thermoanaerobaculia bacterium]
MRTFTIFFFVAASVSAAPPKLGSCSDVKQEIREHGAQRVLERLWENHDRLFGKVVARAADGELCWMEVADSLRSVSDAGASEELDEAMSQALANNPERVLPFFVRDGGFHIDIVCSGSQVAPEDNAKFRRWVKQARSALEKLQVPPGLERERKQCLAEVERAKRSH